MSDVNTDSAGPSAESPQDLTLFVQNLLEQMVRPRRLCLMMHCTALYYGHSSVTNQYICVLAATTLQPNVDHYHKQKYGPNITFLHVLTLTPSPLSRRSRRHGHAHR